MATTHVGFKYNAKSGNLEDVFEANQGNLTHGKSM